MKPIFQTPPIPAAPSLPRRRMEAAGTSQRTLGPASAQSGRVGLEAGAARPDPESLIQDNAGRIGIAIGAVIFAWFAAVAWCDAKLLRSWNWLTQSTWCNWCGEQLDAARLPIAPGNRTHTVCAGCKKKAVIDALKAKASYLEGRNILIVERDPNLDAEVAAAFKAEIVARALGVRSYDNSSFTNRKP